MTRRCVVKVAPATPPSPPQGERMNVCFKCNPVSPMQEDEAGFFCPIHGSPLSDPRDNGGEYSKWCRSCSRPEAVARPGRRDLNAPHVRMI